VSALEHQATPFGDALDHGAAVDPSGVLDRPRRRSWELLLWILSAALVASGAALLWPASTDGSFDMEQTATTIEMDAETGRIASCQTRVGPCPRTLATDGLAYALALPALGSGTTGLLLGIALRARRTTQQQPEPQSHLHPQPQPQPQHERSALPQKAPAQPEQLLRPRDARATPPSPRSLRDGTTASFAPFMPPGQQPDDDPARR
jgi:hypothetical protein